MYAQMARSSAKRGNGSSGQFSSWKKRNQLNTIPGVIDAALTNFPVYIDETILNNLPDDIWNIALNGGGDIRFSSDAQGVTRLSCEIVDFDTAAETAEIHVNVASISNTVATHIYMFYGKAGQSQPASGAAFGRDATWNSDYIFVCHCGTGTDSTGQTTLTAYNATSITGKVGKAADFNGSSQEIDYSNLPGPASNNATIEFWANFDQLATGTIQSPISGDGDPGTFHVEQQSGSDNLLLYMDGSNPSTQQSTWNFTVNTWEHVSINYDVGGLVVDFRRNYSDLDDDFYTSMVALGTDDEITIGAWYNSGFQRFMDGSMDEVRISKVSRADAYLKASYENQNLTTNFLQAQQFITP